MSALIRDRPARNRMFPFPIFIGRFVFFGLM
jgi:hypothetical protein